MKKKIVIGIVSVALVICMIVSGTIAYLTSTPESIKNLFVMGDKLEVEFDEDEDEGITDHEYDIKPGVDVTKTAKVTVKEGSADSYVFIELDKSDNFDTYFDTIVLDTTAGWAALDAAKYPNVYYVTVAASEVEEGDKALYVFDENKLATKSDFSAIEGDLYLEIFVGAIQNYEDDDLDDAEAAWLALTSDAGTLIPADD